MALVLHESAEMYLETIYILNQKLEGVHAVDIAKSMGYSKPTISEWIHKLAKGGLVSIDSNSHITLTEEGEAIATRIYDRHVLLTDFFQMIGVTHAVAENDACRIEHYISDTTIDALKKHIASLD